MNRLQKIIQQVQLDLHKQKERQPLKAIEKAARQADKPWDFRSAIGTPGPLQFIAEIKRKSPSGGALKPGLKPGSLAKDYEKAGASALSVLTNGPYFGGSLDDLAEARNVTRLPVLRKDFIIDPYQVFESRAWGADAILLIAAALTNESLANLSQHASELDMAVLVEVHDAPELERALKLKNSLIGINNRNLKTLTTDTSTVLKLERLVPNDVPVIAESGYKTPEDIRALFGTKVRAVLVGESLLRNANPSEALRTLVEAGKQAQNSKER